MSKPVLVALGLVLSLALPLLILTTFAGSSDFIPFHTRGNHLGGQGADPWWPLGLLSLLVSRGT